MEDYLSVYTVCSLRCDGMSVSRDLQYTLSSASRRRSAKFSWCGVSINMLPSVFVECWVSIVWKISLFRSPLSVSPNHLNLGAHMWLRVTVLRIVLQYDVKNRITHSYEYDRPLRHYFWHVFSNFGIRSSGFEVIVYWISMHHLSVLPK